MDYEKEEAGIRIWGREGTDYARQLVIMLTLKSYASETDQD